MLVAAARALSLFSLSLLAIGQNPAICSSKEDNATADCKTILVSSSQVAKNPRPVEYRGNGMPPQALAHLAAEWPDRVDLAAAARTLYMYGFGDQAAQCAMARVRSEPTTMLSNEWGFFFEETTASSLVKTDIGPDAPEQGLFVDTVTGERRGPADASLTNTGCVPVARAIFRERPDVNVILHLHPYAVMAVAGTPSGLLPVSQAAFMFHKQISRYPYDFSYGPGFEEKIAAGFSMGQRAMILNHHGMYVVGRNAAEAWFVAYHVNQAAEVQIKAMSTGADLNKLMPSEADLDAQYEDMMTSTDYSYDGSREWAGVVRKLNRELPGYEL